MSGSFKSHSDHFTTDRASERRLLGVGAKEPCVCKEVRSGCDWKRPAEYGRGNALIVLDLTIWFRYHEVWRYAEEGAFVYCVRNGSDVSKREEGFRKGG